VVVVAPTAVVVVAPTAVVVVVVMGSRVVVVIAAAAMGAVGVMTAGVTTAGVVVSGTGGNRSANVVGRQAAWAGATATMDTKRTQAKKSVVPRVLKVLSGYPLGPSAGNVPLGGSN
jgi:hypothetical protein